jgi:hypothetical protein
VMGLVADQIHTTQSASQSPLRCSSTNFPSFSLSLFSYSLLQESSLLFILATTYPGPDTQTPPTHTMNVQYSHSELNRIIKRLPIRAPTVQTNLRDHVIHSLLKPAHTRGRHPDLNVEFRNPLTNPPWIWPGNFECWGFREKYPKYWAQTPRTASIAHPVWDNARERWKYGTSELYPAFLLSYVFLFG